LKADLPNLKGLLPILEVIPSTWGREPSKFRKRTLQVGSLPSILKAGLLNSKGILLNLDGDL
jgi:hypothetical protein